MKKIKYILGVLLLIIGSSCTHDSKTEKHQDKRGNITDVHSDIKEIQTGDVLIGSIARSFILGDYLIIGDYKSSDKLIHIFDKNSFDYLASTAYVGQGPGEITMMGNIGTDETRRKFYVSDHGKQMIFSYDIDSVLANPYYMPEVKLKMNKAQFPDKYNYVNDTLSIALLIEPTSVSKFKQSVAKWNMQTGTFTPMKYQHPDIKKKRISFDASIEKGIYVECYTYHDLMSICRLDDGLLYNIYGPAWDEQESNKVHHYGSVKFCGDKIIASYSGGENFSDEYAPTQFLVFDLEGNYLKTLDVGYKIVDFCYDRENNRLIINFNDEIQFGYLDLKKYI